MTPTSSPVDTKEETASYNFSPWLLTRKTVEWLATRLDGRSFGYTAFTSSDTTISYKQTEATISITYYMLGMSNKKKPFPNIPTEIVTIDDILRNILTHGRKYQRCIYMYFITYLT